MALKTRTTQPRNRAGQIAVELPTVLWILLFFLFFPLLNLCAVGLRTTIVSVACHRSCLAAARARSFQTPIGNYLSSVDIAPEMARYSLNKFSGIRLVGVATQIVETNIVSRNITVYSTPLPKPAQTDANTYQAQVTLITKIDPFIYCPLPTDVPGVNSPMSVVMSDRQYFEATQSLHI